MIDQAYFLAFILVFIRMITFFGLVPIFFPQGLPNTTKIAFTAVISFMLIPGINYSAINVTNNYQLITLVIGEATTGLTLGYLVNLCFNSIKMAGQLLDMQIGFSMITIFDPSSNSNVTFVENILYWFSVMIFFAIDGHHMLIQELIHSFDVIPLGKFILTQGSITVVISCFIQFFTIGLKIAIPIIMIMIITELTMGLIARTVPQLNIMVLGLPIKILLGLTCISISLPILLKYFVMYFNQIPDVLKGFYKVLPFVIVFASEDKSEEATPKKKQEAREKGQVAKSKEVSLTFTLLASTSVIALLGSYIINNFQTVMTAFFTNYLHTNLDYNTVKGIAFISAWRIALIIFPVVIPIMAFGIISNYVQTGFIFSKETIKPQLSKLNPINGFKRMFSTRTFVELIKDFAIVIIVGYIGYSFIMSNFTSMLNSGNISINSIPDVMKKFAVSIFTKITLVMVVISLIDYIYQRRQYNKELKMSKQEVKEEFKQQEGDPQIKGKIRQRQREMARRRMMAQVPNATVVVTNPTHLAVALRYEEGVNEAPKVVAKGADNTALRIKEIAKENDVPIIENKPLARLIYNEVELDSEVPVDMYQAIAEILALVFKMKKRK